jgi:predicted transcriptional regulator
LEDRSLSEIFEVVGGRLRTNFVLALRDGPLRPAQLSQKLDAPISNLYRIFNELKHAGLVESFEKDGLVYWKLTEFGVKWINANIEAITGSLEKGSSKVAYRRRKILLLIPTFILIFSAVRAIASSEPTWFIGGIILSAIAYLIIEKIK